MDIVGIQSFGLAAILGSAVPPAAILTMKARLG